MKGNLLRTVPICAYVASSTFLFIMTRADFPCIVRSFTASILTKAENWSSPAHYISVVDEFGVDENLFSLFSFDGFDP